MICDYLFKPGIDKFLQSKSVMLDKIKSMNFSAVLSSTEPPNSFAVCNFYYRRPFRKIYTQNNYRVADIRKSGPRRNF